MFRGKFLCLAVTSQENQLTVKTRESNSENDSRFHGQPSFALVQDSLLEATRGWIGRLMISFPIARRLFAGKGKKSKERTGFNLLGIYLPDHY